jgi:hypothetical protein
MKKFAVIKVDGSMDFHDVDPEKEYDFLSGSVGGWIQSVSLSNQLEGFDLYCNEEGKLNGLPVNWTATYLWELSYGKTDVLVGDVVLTGGADDEGETLGLSQEQMDRLTNLLVLA